ncbi:hypothetical protein P3S67_008112 [Capsicum chacoense]
MSDNIPNPTDWVQIYQHTLSRQQQPPPPPPLQSTAAFRGVREFDATTVITTPTSSSSCPSVPQHHGHGPVGRDSRPIRRRSRVSRRTPTTVYNTDTRNFRAMVQQFTGNQNQPVQSEGPVRFFGPRNINLVNPRAYSIQFQQQVQQNQQQVQQNVPPLSQIGETLFFHGLENYASSSRSNMEISENLVMDVDRSNNTLPRQHQRGRN